MLTVERDATTTAAHGSVATPRLAIATVCLSGTLEDKLAAAAAAGFHGVEIFENDLIASPWSPQRVRPGVRPPRAVDRCRTSRFATSRRSRPSVFRGQPAPGRAQVRRAGAARRRHDAASARRCRPTRSTTTTSPPSSCTSWPPGRSSAACGSPTRRWRGAGSSTPTRTPGGSCGTPTIPPSACAWTASTCCPAATTRPASGSYPASKVFHLQLADAPRLNMDVVEWSRHHRLFPGLGSFDLTGFVGHVLTTGYDGPLSLEVFNDVYRQADPRHAAIDGMRSLLAPAGGGQRPRPGAGARSGCGSPACRRRPGSAGTSSPSWPSTRSPARSWRAR